ncbi:ATP-binding protein [Oculatella sp. FACHB-28]|uniref:ATP-binding protein n=1 Tax=Oculatella sp. FACHB-28 TaxID=2692845 RepID=UPI0016883B04|nr:ATP-binding protein [Oculatella sp. FACHB-28]MBD2055307.1 ATP-binding protein [Oculatella sp. FACHB-28]
MTNFNRSKIQRTAHDWLAIADEANEKSGNPTLVATAGVIGGLAFASLTASPLVAAIPIGWGVWEAWKINGRKAKNDEAIAVGCVASILTNELFHQFRQQVGDEVVYDQLDWAEESRLPLSRDAQDFLTWYRQFKQPQLPATEMTGELPAAQDQEPAGAIQQEQQQVVGTNTRLNAVNVPAQALDDFEDTTPAVPVQQPVFAQPAAIAPVANRQASTPQPTLEDLLCKGASPEQIAQRLNFHARLKLLERSMRQHEGGWLISFIRTPVALIIGRPGSGKSSFAGFVAMARELMFSVPGYCYEGVQPIRSTLVADPNAHLKIDSIWSRRWDVRGSGDDFKAVEDSIREMYKAFANSRGENWRQWIYDEMTAWSGAISDVRLLGGFLPQVTSKARASLDFIIGCSHNDTLEALGGKAGQARLKDDMTSLYLGSKNTPNGVVPTLNGLVCGLDFDDHNRPIEQKISLQSWMQPSFLEAMFPEVYSAPSETTNAIGDTETLKVSDALGEPLKTIWLFAKEQGDWIKPRDVQRKNFSVLKDANSEKIRQYFGLLSDMNYGEIDESGESVTFRAN